MIVGRGKTEDDITVNVCKAKKLTNMRASGSDDAPNLTPPETTVRSSGRLRSSTTTS